ncbi:MAG: hypothetical protein QOJ35_3191 [Solirubrobacteraceae bacterium]|jgi:PAS domain S-box-containing protein|nr:hypothetical protein [Solirubrobacteraceae bacterium]
MAEGLHIGGTGEDLTGGPRTTTQAQAVFDASPVPTAITRAADGVILFANPAWLEMLGWQDGAYLGATMLEAGFWTRPERRAAMVERLARDGVVRDLEEEVTTTGGETKTVLLSISRFELDGEPCLLGNIHDITERRAGEERFRQVTETIQQGFVLSELDPGTVLYASPSVARIFGIELDALYRDPGAIERLIHPDDRAEVLARRDAMTGARDFEFRIVRPDGETRWIRTRAEPVTTKRGQVARIASVSEDVTAEHQLREALRESEERFRLLAEHSTDVIGRLSLDMRIEYVSPASRYVYGYEPEAMIGRFGFEFVHPDDLAELREDFTARGMPTEVVTNIYRVIRGDGVLVWVEAKIRPRYDPVTGEPLEFHTVARDVSERVQAEADVRRAKEEAERAQDEAERANAAKSEFLSRMSHELRTPLHAILGFGELLERDELTAPQHERLGQITTAGRHLLELINEVLDLSRIERGALGLSLEPVCVADVVDGTLAMIEPLAAARSVSVTTAMSGVGDVHVLADRQRLRQVLLNLLSNAVKYNREGGSIEVAGALAGPAGARIQVSDTGVGIAAEDLARAFDPFERLGAEAGEVEGTGLGLALTKRLVEAMGGEIGVESDVGDGTTVWFELAAVAAPAAPSPPADAAGPAHVARAPVRRTVLYIEDNPSNVKLVEAILALRPEISLLVATRGDLGLRLACEHRPALILLDLNLPDMSGEEVLRRLRDDPRCAASAIVMLSADATPGQMTRLRRAGADEYLTKPFEIDRFLAVVDAFPAAGDGDGDHDRPPTARGAGATCDDHAGAGSAPPPTGPIDLARLTKLRAISSEAHTLGELLDVFMRDSSASLRALTGAAAAGDAEAVRRAAHAWKGACGMAGVHRVAAQLAGIERRAHAEAIPDEQALAALVAAYEEAEAALLRELA